MNRKIILFELNEVPFRILEEYCRWRPESTLAKRLPLCRKHETLAQDEGILSPWITWPTLHRGVPNTVHEIGDFGQDLAEIDALYPPVWSLLAAHGVRVGVGGSLHSYPMPSNLSAYDFFLPDTFASGPEAHPPKLGVFQHFNLAMAKESARNVSKKVPWKAALDFALAVPSLGLKLKTFAAIAGQLVDEARKPARKTRRRTYQSVLAFDVYMHFLRKTRPQFSTFFSNHVASAMHRYWAAAFPGDYPDFGYDPEWVSTYRDEILFAMDKTDAIFKELTDFAERNPEYSVWMTSSMGQAPTLAEPCESQLYVTGPETFMQAMGVSPSDWKKVPSMLPRFNFFVTDAAASAFRGNLEELRVNGEKVVYREGEQNFFSVSFGQMNLDPKTSRVTLRGELRSFEAMGLSQVEIEDKSGTTAYHVPEGSLVIYDPRDLSLKEKGQPVATTEIAPALLRHFGVSVPGYMNASTLSAA